MIVRDCLVHFELYGGTGISEIWKGYVDTGYDEESRLRNVFGFPVDGKNLVLNQLNSQNFIKITDKIYNVKEIKSVSFGEETEREAP